MVKYSIFYYRLKEQIKLNRKTFNQVERELGYPRNALNNYKNGTGPSGERLVELAEYFRISPGYLIGKHNKKENASLRKSFHNLCFEQKIELYSICESWVKSELNKKQS